jgi:hypothetical protein
MNQKAAATRHGGYLQHKGIGNPDGEKQYKKNHLAYITPDVLTRKIRPAFVSFSMIEVIYHF